LKAARCMEHHMLHHDATMCHNDAMRTTVDLDDAMLDRAKHLALREGRTLSSVVSEALAAYLGARKQAQKAAPFELLVRGHPRARFPSPAEIAAAEDAEELGALQIPSVKRRASP
jgi:hypothetical protein